MDKPTVAIACDHAGVELKDTIKAELATMGFVLLDLGTNNNESVDYPDFANHVANAILSKKASHGVLICGSGVGMSIAANRHKGIRAALCHTPDYARLSRQHNDANVVCLGARLLSVDTAIEIVRTFFTTAYEGGRHQRRVEKMD